MVIYQPTPQLVSTHSRPKAADAVICDGVPRANVSTHSRPKAAERCTSQSIGGVYSFNTQPPEGG